MHDTALAFSLCPREIFHADQLAAEAETSRSRATQPFGWLFEGKRAPLRRGSSETWDVEYVCAVSGGRGSGGICSGVGGDRLNRVDTDSSVEEGRSEEIGVTRTPIDLESPVVSGRQLQVEMSC